MLNIYQLSIFTTVVQSGSFSAAAEKLHLTQPAVSLQIRSLEKHLGAKLFERNGQRIELTEAANELLPRARDLIRMASRTEEAMSALRGIVKGSLTIGCSSSPGKYIVPKIVGSFKRQHPEVRPIVEALTVSGAIKKLLDREVDLGVVGIKARDKALEYHKLMDDELVVILPPRHQLARHTSIDPEELARESLILREEHSGTRLTIDEGFHRHGLSSDRLDVVMEIGSSEGVALAVEAGLGVSLISRITAQRFAGKIKIVKLDSDHFHRQIYLVRHREGSRGDAGIRFWDFLQTHDTEELISNEINR